MIKIDTMFGRPTTFLIDPTALRPKLISKFLRLDPPRGLLSYPQAHGNFLPHLQFLGFSYRVF